MFYHFILPIALFLLASVPLVFAVKLKKHSSKRFALAANVVSVLLVCVFLFGSSTVNVFAETPADEVSEQAEGEASGGKLSNVSAGAGLGMLAAAFVTAMSCIGAGIAVSSSASAAIGAMSENPKVFGKAMIFVALAEGVALYGLLVSLQILSLLQ